MVERVVHDLPDVTDVGAAQADGDNTSQATRIHSFYIYMYTYRPEIYRKRMYTKI